MTAHAKGGVFVGYGQQLFPVFTPDVGNGVQLAVTNGASARVALPTTSPVVRIHASGDCFLNFGDSSVTAATTNMPHDVGAEYYGVPDGATYVAAWGNGENGTLTVTPMDQ